MKLLFAAMITVGLVGCHSQAPKAVVYKPGQCLDCGEAHFSIPTRTIKPAPFKLLDPNFEIDCPDDMRPLWPSNRETAAAMDSKDYKKFGRSKWQAEHTYCVSEDY